MTDQFFDRPILNSPYVLPAQYWELDEGGQPTNRILPSRRECSLTTPVPKPKKAPAEHAADRHGAGQRHRTVFRRAGVQSAADHQRGAQLRRNVAQPAKPGPVAGHAGDGAPAQALAQPPIPERPSVLLPGRGDRDGDLAGRGGAKVGWHPQVPEPPRRCQRPGQPGTPAHRAQARHRCRQDHRHGDADRLADGQRGAPPEQQVVLARLLDRGTGHHHPRSPAGAAAQRPGELLPAS